VKRVLVGVLIGVGALFGQFFSGNQGDIPTPILSKDLNFHISAFGGFRGQSNYYNEETYKAVLPKYGLAFGLSYKTIFFNIGYSKDKNAEVTLQHTAWNNGKVYLLFGINGLLIPSLESEGTQYTPSDSTAKFFRVPVFAEIYARPFKFLEGGLGVGLGKFAQNKYLEEPLKIPGVYLTIGLKPFNFLKIFWEGYSSTWKRNVGLVLGPFRGVEVFTVFRYCAYPPGDKVSFQQVFAGVRFEVPKEAVFKLNIVDVKIFVKEQATGRPVANIRVESSDGKFMPIMTDSMGVAHLPLKPGIYPVKVNGAPKYAPSSAVLEVTGKEKSLSFEVRLRYSKEYTDYVAILDRAREFLSKDDLKNAQIELGKALKIFPNEPEGLSLQDTLISKKKTAINSIMQRAQTYLANKRYQDAINELQRILVFDEGNQDIRKKIDSIRIVMLEERKRTVTEERPVVVSPPPQAKPKPTPPEEKISAPELVDRGKKLFFEGKYREAKTYFERALKLDPANKEAKFYLDKCESYIKMMGQ